MTISEMTDDERHTFGALVRAMVGADGSTSLEESGDLHDTARQLGSDDFWSLIRDTAGTDHEAETIQARANSVVRREAQETIYGVLFSIARAGSIVGREAALLDRLATTWSIKSPTPEDEPT